MGTPKNEESKGGLDNNHGHLLPCYGFTKRKTVICVLVIAPGYKRLIDAPERFASGKPPLRYSPNECGFQKERGDHLAQHLCTILRVF